MVTAPAKVIQAGTGAPFTRAQALAAGYAPAEVRRLLRGGTWVPLRRGVYVAAADLARLVDQPERRHAVELAGLLLVLGRDAVGGGTSAARILGLEMLTAPPPELVVVVNGRLAHGERRSDYVVRSATLPDSHRVIRHGVPITSAARTVVDLARHRPLEDGVVVIDSALRRGLASQSSLHEVLADVYTWPGIDQARRAVLLADPASESVLESVSRVAMHLQGVPAPQTQVVLTSGGPVARVDFYWRQFAVIGEADGLAKYQSANWRQTADILRAEKRREERLTDLGFEVVRWGWDDARNPARLANRLRAAFARGIERQNGRRAAS